MADPLIRRYKRRDREALLRITDMSFGGFCIDSCMEHGFGRIAGSNWQQRKRAAILFDLGRNARHTFVCEIDGVVVGYVCTRTYPDLKTGHIANMAVSPAHQNHGIGRQLIDAALDHFREEGMQYSRIETLESNERARHLYPELGFREIGRQVFYLREL